MAVPSTMEPTNVLALSCSMSSLRMTRGLLIMASHRRNGGTELPPPPSSVRTEQARIPPVVNLPHSTRTSPGRKRLWRVTNGRLSVLSASDRHRRGLEYEVSLGKTRWLPKARLETKLVRRYRAEQRAATRVRTRWSSRLQEASSSETAARRQQRR
jgi:hypothetical protein